MYYISREDIDCQLLRYLPDVIYSTCLTPGYTTTTTLVQPPSRLMHVFDLVKCLLIPSYSLLFRDKIQIIYFFQKKKTRARTHLTKYTGVYTYTMMM